MKQSSTFYKRTGKRIFDLALTIPGIIILSPLLAITALLVRVKLGSPVLFQQADVPGPKKVFLCAKMEYILN